ncbi:tubulin delta [Cyclospora cayetanensis]|uniref:Tubulin delta n=1 Tax=Cyclospora cayetanensis TaxID=88456 RepID=A0A1D3D2Q8_9EIME|nr:tubulin delta [Cyclospora cayetanensis]
MNDTAEPISSNEELGPLGSTSRTQTSADSTHLLHNEADIRRPPEKDCAETQPEEACPAGTAALIEQLRTRQKERGSEAWDVEDADVDATRLADVAIRVNRSPSDDTAVSSLATTGVLCPIRKAQSSIDFENACSLPYHPQYLRVVKEEEEAELERLLRQLDEEQQAVRDLAMVQKYKLMQEQLALIQHQLGKENVKIPELEWLMANDPENTHELDEVIKAFAARDDDLPQESSQGPDIPLTCKNFFCRCPWISVIMSLCSIKRRHSVVKAVETHVLNEETFGTVAFVGLSRANTWDIMGLLDCRTVVVSHSNFVTRKFFLPFLMSDVALGFVLFDSSVGTEWMDEYDTDYVGKRRLAAVNSILQALEAQNKAYWKRDELYQTTHEEENLVLNKLPRVLSATTLKGYCRAEPEGADDAFPTNSTLGPFDFFPGKYKEAGWDTARRRFREIPLDYPADEGMETRLVSSEYFDPLRVALSAFLEELKSISLEGKLHVEQSRPLRYNNRQIEYERSREATTVIDPDKIYCVQEPDAVMPEIRSDDTYHSQPVYLVDPLKYWLQKQAKQTQKINSTSTTTVSPTP